MEGRTDVSTYKGCTLIQRPIGGVLLILSVHLPQPDGDYLAFDDEDSAKLYVNELLEGSGQDAA